MCGVRVRMGSARREVAWMRENLGGVSRGTRREKESAGRTRATFVCMREREVRSLRDKEMDGHVPRDGQL
jgi:hypothetical protein